MQMWIFVDCILNFYLNVVFVPSGQCFPMWWMISRFITQISMVTKPSSTPSMCSSSSLPLEYPWVSLHSVWSKLSDLYFVMNYSHVYFHVTAHQPSGHVVNNHIIPQLTILPNCTHISSTFLHLSAFFRRFAGYETGSCSQPETVSLTLKVLVSPVPVVLIVVGLLILKTYPIDEERRQDNRKQLQKML